MTQVHAALLHVENGGQRLGGAAVDPHQKARAGSAVGAGLAGRGTAQGSRQSDKRLMLHGEILAGTGPTGVTIARPPRPAAPAAHSRRRTRNAAVTITDMAPTPIFPQTKLDAGMYESFYLRAVSPEEPVGVWIRYTAHKRPGQAPQGSIWCTVFDAKRGAPFMHKHTTAELAAPRRMRLGRDRPGLASGTGPVAEGVCGPARWSLRFEPAAAELRHLARSWLYKAPLPRTKPTSPAPAATFDGRGRAA